MYRNTLNTITSILVLTLSLSFSQVVINQIHFNPASSQGSDNDYEILELYNQMKFNKIGLSEKADIASSSTIGINSTISTIRTFARKTLPRLTSY